MKKKHTYSRAEATEHLIRDIAIIFVSVVVAVLIGQSGMIHTLIAVLPVGSIVAIFTAGVLFTSMFTIAPASIVLAEIGQNTGVWEVALIGAIGAVAGDIILFLFMRENISEDLEIVMKGKYFHKVTRWSHFGFFRWIFPLVGALVIASPLPDELGLAMMGLSRVKTIYMIPIVFVMNFLGIYMLVTFGRSI